LDLFLIFLDTGLIVGVIIAALVVLGLIFGGFYYFKSPRNSNSARLMVNFFC